MQAWSNPGLVLVKMKSEFALVQTPVSKLELGQFLLAQEVDFGKSTQCRFSKAMVSLILECMELGFS